MASNDATRTSSPEFLDLEDVLELHARGLARWGGAQGIRDQGSLLSAIAQPQATFGGDYVHEDLFAMAAAYAFHIAEAQAFLDGNKRAGVLAAVVFLDMNGFRIPEHEDVVYLAMIEISRRKMTKHQLAGLLRDLANI
jgi:death on curing protein